MIKNIFIVGTIIYVIGIFYYYNVRRYRRYRKEIGTNSLETNIKDLERFINK